MINNYNELQQKILNFRDKKHPKYRLVFFNKTISLKTQLSKSDIFLKSDLYKEILEATNFLDVYNIEIPIWFRFKCIFKNIHQIKSCVVCNKIASLNFKSSYEAPVFNTTCGNSICIAKYASSKISSQTTELKKIHAEKMLNRRNNLRLQYQKLINIYTNQIQQNAYVNKNTTSQIKQICESIKNTQYKNSVLIKESFYFANIDILSDILNLTCFIPLNIKDLNKISASEFKWHERIFCILNDIKTIQKCKCCKIENVKFINHLWQYTKNCSKCVGETYREKIGLQSIDEIINSVDKSKYEILFFPKNDFKNNPLKIKCKTCGYISEIYLINGKLHYLKNLCKNCEKYVSSPEQDIRQLISNYTSNIIVNNREIINPMELDIYIPEKKLAIEYDGLYWHNDNVVKSNYHLIKTNLCEKQGIQLIHIFENEWLTKQNIVKSRLKNLLGVYDQSVFARKCEIKEVDSKTSKEFQEKNHIQGSVNAKVHVGLYFEDKLISLMTFGKCRFDKKHEWELLRFCNKLGYHIPGAASKLLKYFEINYQPKSLVSYADRRWSQGKVYEKLGFICIHKSSPNYWYWKNTKIPLLESRIKYQKHKLKDLLENFDESKTEVENMKENGYNRIFDCGNLVYEKIYEKWIS